jgi:hypothetical protein
MHNRWRKPLGYAAVLLFGLLAFFGSRWLFSEPRKRSPEELANLALTADTLREQEEAAGELTSAGEPGVPQMVRVLKDSRTPEVRAAMIQGLALQWVYESMPAILDALDDESPFVRLRAGSAVQRMTCVDAGYRAEDPPEERQPAVARYRKQWDQVRDSADLKQWKSRLQQKGIGRGAE